jgi:RibD C-terminal domain
MSKVFSAHAVSVDGYISGRTPDGDEEFGRGLGDAPMLFDWYMDGDTPSRMFDGFKLSEPSARFFDAVAARVGATVAGRTTTGINDAIAAAREAAAGLDVALMGGGVLTSALEAGLVDEIILHQVPVLLGAGHSFFQALPEHVQLRVLEVIPAPGVTHLHYEVVR